MRKLLPKNATKRSYLDRFCLNKYAKNRSQKLLAHDFQQNVWQLINLFYLYLVDEK